MTYPMAAAVEDYVPEHSAATWPNEWTIGSSGQNRSSWQNGASVRMTNVMPAEYAAGILMWVALESPDLDIFLLSRIAFATCPTTFILHHRMSLIVISCWRSAPDVHRDTTSSFRTRRIDSEHNWGHSWLGSMHSSGFVRYMPCGPTPNIIWWCHASAMGSEHFW